MPGYLTVFGTVADAARALGAVRALGREPDVHPPDSAPSAWQVLRLPRETGYLELNWLDAEREQAELVQMREGMTAYFRRVRGVPAQGRARPRACARCDVLGRRGRHRHSRLCRR